MVIICTLLVCIIVGPAWLDSPPVIVLPYVNLNNLVSELLVSGDTFSDCGTRLFP